MPLVEQMDTNMLPGSAIFPLLPGSTPLGKRTNPLPEGFQPMTVAEAREILERHNWTQAAFARTAGVHLRTAQRWFADEGDVPGPVAALLRLYDKFPGCRPPELARRQLISH